MAWTYDSSSHSFTLYRNVTQCRHSLTHPEVNSLVSAAQGDAAAIYQTSRGCVAHSWWQRGRVRLCSRTDCSCVCVCDCACARVFVIMLVYVLLRVYVCVCVCVCVCHHHAILYHNHMFSPRIHYSCAIPWNIVRYMWVGEWVGWRLGGWRERAGAIETQGHRQMDRQTQNLYPRKWGYDRRMCAARSGLDSWCCYRWNLCCAWLLLLPILLLLVLML